jgi:hypothetical protein
MLCDTFTIQEKKQGGLSETDKITIFNKQITESLDKKIESVEYELLKLSDMLLLNGDLLNEK